MPPKAAPVDPEILKQRRQEMAKRLIEMNAKKREEKLVEDEALLKTCTIGLELLEQGYEEKVKRMFAKHDVAVKSVKDITMIMEKTKARIEKTKMATTRKKEVNKDEPEAKKRREDMNDDEKREFDSWLDQVRIKRQELLEKRSARHFRKQQLTKRYFTN